MQFKIDFRDGTENSLKKEYASFLFDEIKEDIHDQVVKYKEKYEIRLGYVNELFEQEFTFKDILDIFENCLELATVQGSYYIRLNRSKKIKNFFSANLIKTFEYGIPGYIIELPTIRRLLDLYQNEYQSMYVQFMERKFGIK